MKQLSLTLLVILSTAGAYFAQSGISLNIGAKYQPSNWEDLLQTADWYDARDYYSFLPIIQADLSFINGIYGTDWFIETGVSWRYAHKEMILDGRGLPQEIDPFYGFVYENPEGDPIRIIDQFQYLGLKAGAGFRFWSSDYMHILILSGGFQLHAPFGSKIVSNLSGSKKEYPIYHDDQFTDGLYYGMYFKPEYQFSLSRFVSNPWRFKIYLEGDALIHNNSEINPKFLLGGGIGIAFYFWGSGC